MLCLNVQMKIRLEHVYEVWSDALTEGRWCITRCWLKETVTVWCSIPTEHINKQSSQNAKRLVLYTGSSSFTVRPWRVKTLCMEDQLIVMLLPWQAICPERYSKTPPQLFGLSKKARFPEFCHLPPGRLQNLFSPPSNIISVTYSLHGAESFLRS